MEKKIMTWKTKGMNRDMSTSAFNPEFSFENRNLRLSTNEGNTTLSWVNEKGTKQIEFSSFVDYNGRTRLSSIDGVPVGTAVINHKLILFTHYIGTENDSSDTVTPSLPNNNSETAEILPDTSNHTNKIDKPTHDNIYCFEKNSQGTFDVKRLYKGNLGLSVFNPLETLVSYESLEIQKVYWTDGLNQPRMINIAASQDKINKWNTGNTFFDFVPSINNPLLEVNIQKRSSGGTFSPGVIQYCFSYINRNSQQSNIVYTSPLYYLSSNDKGVSADSKVSSCFNISLKNLDNKFDYVRLYSIQRTSFDGTPIVKHIEDLSIVLITNPDETTCYAISYTDTGTSGSLMDPMELLYIGGKEITALTMVDKDGTLFLGNISQKDILIDSIQQYFNTNIQEITFTTSNTVKQVDLNYSTTPYFNNFGLNKNSRELTTFKGGETYRFGIQLQKANGEWTEPIFLRDKTNHIYPKKDPDIVGEDIYKPVVLSYATTTLTLSSIASAYSSISSNFYNTFKKIRPIIVYPTINDRTVLCQGVLNPTVFNIEDRVTNSPYAQASWFFRPYYLDNTTWEGNSMPLKATHYESLFSSNSVSEYYAMEIQGMYKEYNSVFTNNKETLTSNTQFFIDQSIVTLNSPDLEFDTEVQTFGTDGLHLRIVGAIPITGTASSHKIHSSSAMVELNYDSSAVEVNSKTSTYGIGELSHNVIYKNINTEANKRLISGLLWNDARVYVSIQDKETIVKTDIKAADYYIYPWHRTGSLTNDARSKAEASSFLDTKRMANLWFSCDSFYIPVTSEDNLNSTLTAYKNVGTQIHLTENDHIINYRLPKQANGLTAINYYANIDKVLVNSNGYGIGAQIYTDTITGSKANIGSTTDPISMKYKSTSHAIISLPGGTISGNERNNGNPFISILPYGIQTISSTPINCGEFKASIPSTTSANTFWKENISRIDQPYISLDNLLSSKGVSFLWIGELYREIPSSTRFGGRDKDAILNNKWLPAGEEVSFNSTTNTVTLNWTDGDTYYQRYDCLKTYPFTEEDTNQIIEILSFMCETHINIDGRYDRNRGQLDNTMIRPTNFNLLNPVYSQKNNFFTYRKIDTEGVTETKYPNQIYYSKTKTSGADVDLWTNVTLASMLELDGDKGEITSLQRLNDQLIAFQDSGIAQILYNEQVQISTSEGVPIEIANSGKVQGKRYISNTIGCSNKWSIANTPTGIYFMDNNDKSIYLFNGQLNNLSTSLGFNSWSKKNISASSIWNPQTFNGFVTYYDKKNQDVLFISSEEALAYSEKFNCFTSFYDYGKTPYLCNLDDDSIWIKEGTLWEHQGGDYCKFFDENKPFSITLIGSQDPLFDKTFTNIEFQANVDGEGVYTEATDGIKESFYPTLPFNTLEVWNEYQHGINTLNIRQSQSPLVKATLERKFRIWRCDIPRDNAPINSTSEALKGIKRFKVRPLDRIRNPWIYLKLEKEASDSSSMQKTEIHDIMATYFV